MYAQAVWEAEELKAQLLETESRLSELEAHAEKEATQRAEAERLLASERKLTAQLQVSILLHECLSYTASQTCRALDLAAYLVHLTHLEELTGSLIINGGLYCVVAPSNCINLSSGRIWLAGEGSGGCTAAGRAPGALRCARAHLTAGAAER